MESARSLILSAKLQLRNTTFHISSILSKLVDLSGRQVLNRTSPLSHQNDDGQKYGYKRIRPTTKGNESIPKIRV